MLTKVSRLTARDWKPVNIPVIVKSPQIRLFCPIYRTFTSPSIWPNSSSRQSILQDGRQKTLVHSSPQISPSKQNSKSARLDLREALVDLKKQAPSYVNLSRLQLVLRSLEQKEGDETIRIAFIGIADGGVSLNRAKALLRLLFADPLKPEEEWERILLAESHKPVLLKIGCNSFEDITYENRLFQELRVTSPTLDRHRLEIVVLEMDPPTNGIEVDSFMDALLVPVMEIPTSSTGRYTPVTTPVHRALIVSEGIPGAVTLFKYPADIDHDIVTAAVDLRVAEDHKSALQFDLLDLATGNEALASFRQSLDNALLYEKSWFASGVPGIMEWLKSGTSPTKGVMKMAVRKLIEFFMRNLTSTIEAERASQIEMLHSQIVPRSEILKFRKDLQIWTERAHTELRDQLDIAFNGHKWRKLVWWKLFWRVDDVSMIAFDILGQRFLCEAEKEVIFLAGRIEERGFLKDVDGVSSMLRDCEDKKPKERESAFSLPLPKPSLQGLVQPPEDVLPASIASQPWPQNITTTRSHLSRETVPALQALAQKLVMQTLSSISLTTILGGLLYFSSISIGMYDAGAVIAMGIVFNLRRMQRRWETVREFWEGEVREEGRKAINNVGISVGHVLSSTEALVTSDDVVDADQDAARARAAVKRAEEILNAYN